MDNKNILIIILIIVIVFFLSADKNINTNTLNNNAFPLLLILIIIYISYNNFSMSLIFICVILLIISKTDIKNILIDRLDFHTNNKFSERLNELFSTINFKNNTQEHLNTPEDIDITEEEEEVYDSTEGLDDISYNDFKKEINNFNGVSIEQTEVNNKSDESSPNVVLNDSDKQPSSNNNNIQDYNKNNGTDINDLFNNLTTQVNSLKSNETIKNIN